MDKNDFLSLINRYTDTSPEEAGKVATLKAEYPYSQLLQTLLARVSKDHAFDNHQQELALAAVLSADRAVLKAVITAEPPPPPVADPSPALVTPLPALEKYPGEDDRDIDYADEVMRDLQKLSSLKTKFEMLLVEYSEVKATPSPGKSKEHVPAPPEEGLPEANREKGKSKKQRIVELARSLNSGPNQPVTSGESKKKSRGTKDTDNPDGLIEEIKSSKKEIQPENEKQKEQIDIINNFIRTQPSISSAKDRIILATGDLNPIRSGEFGDNIVSETLVEILVKQGKKDKAIEVLKKLIWKYPQKKSYFASQIEDLKK